MLQLQQGFLLFNFSKSDSFLHRCCCEHFLSALLLVAAICRCCVACQRIVTAHDLIISPFSTVMHTYKHIFYSAALFTCNCIDFWHEIVVLVVVSIYGVQGSIHIHKCRYVHIPVPTIVFKLCMLVCTVIIMYSRVHGLVILLLQCQEHHLWQSQIKHIVLLPDLFSMIRRPFSYVIQKQFFIAV